MSSEEDSAPRRSLSTHCEEQASLLSLPNEVLAKLFHHMDHQELHSLCLSCRRLHDLVLHFGWDTYLRHHPRPSFSLSCVENHWTSHERSRYNVLVDRRWSERSFIARPLCQAWAQAYVPEIAVSNSCLVVAVGHELDVYRFRRPGPADRASVPGLHFEAKYAVEVSHVTDGRRDITGIAPLFGDVDVEGKRYLVGLADGSVLHVKLPDEVAGDIETDILYNDESSIESVSVTSSMSFTLTDEGRGTLRSLVTQDTSVIQLNGKGRSSLIGNLHGPYVAVGSTCATMPFAVYPIYETGLLSTPIAATVDPHRKGSPVYGITGPPPQLPCDPGQVLVTGSFDGFVRLYDLRTPSHPSTNVPSANNIPHLKPVLRMRDPLISESIYCVSSGGGSGYTIAAGLSRHSVVAFWDVRNTRSGWSVYSPGSDPSPVYSLCMESSRVFGATQSRAFTFDFSPEDMVCEETYPPVETQTSARDPRWQRRNIDRTLKKHGKYGFFTTTYTHLDPLAAIS